MLTFAISTDKKILRIGSLEKIPKEARPDCFCAACEQPLIPRLGERNAYHFAHYPESKCYASDGEGAIHLSAKLQLQKLLIDTASRSDKLHLRGFCSTCRKDSLFELPLNHADSIVIEKKCDEFRPDIQVLRGDRVLCALEVVDKHSCSTEKWIDLSVKAPVIEVRAQAILDLREGSDLPFLRQSKITCTSCKALRKDREKQFTSIRLISFDCETYLFQPGCAAPKIVCSSWYAPDLKEPVVLQGPKQACNLLAYYLANDYTITGAKIDYDFGVCAAYDPSIIPLIFQAYDQGRVFDIQIALLLHLIAEGCVTDTGLLHPETRKPLLRPSGGRAQNVSLEVAVSLVLGRNDAKKNDYWRKRYALLDPIPLEQWPTDAIQYPKDDAINTYQVAQALLKGDYKNKHQQSEQAYAAWALQLSSIWGIRTEKAALDQVEKEKRDELAALIKQFMPLGLIDAQGKEIAAEVKRRVVAAYRKKPHEKCPACDQGKVKGKGKAKINCKVCDGTGVEITGAPQTDGGKVATDRDTLEESGDDMLDAFGAVSKVHKVLDTYIPDLRFGEQYAITTEPNVLVNTGRSSYKGIIQTIPRDGGLRECFVARPGRVFCSVDYNGLELVTLAQVLLWVCGESKMADALNAGLDLHSLFAAQMLGIGYDEFITRLNANDPVCLAYRQAAKAANFGFPGGMGPVKLVLAQRKVGIRFCEVLENARCGAVKVHEWRGKPVALVCKRCIELAVTLRDNWLKQWPEMDYYLNKFISGITRGDCTIEQFVSKRIRGGLDYCSAANTFFQGLAADGAKKALVRITKECYLDPKSPLFGSRVLIFIHDETFMEHRIETAHEAAHRQAEIMVDTMREYTPDVLIKAEPALCLRWYKKAKPVYKDGRLVPWEPPPKS